MQRRRWMLALIVIAVTLASLRLAPAGAATRRFYPQTGYAIDDPSFVDFFDHRGGVKTFGYPVSREFTFLGFPVQIFQRAIMQRFPDGRVQLLNLLDDGLFPYTQVNGAHFPPPDASLTRTAPAVGSKGYDQAVLNWVNRNAPDSWNGMKVGFRQSFVSTVSVSDVFPSHLADLRSLLRNPNRMTGFDLEIWGLPTSRPSFDPQNTRFVYQRFQRGIMHFDQSTGATQGILLADYFKDVLMAENLPPDLAAAAKGSRYYGQYNPLKPGWVDRPDQLPKTDLSHAFEPAPVVVLDPGHGGQEIGAAIELGGGTVLQEKDLNLTVAGRVAALLRQGGYTVVQTRTTDSWVDSKLVDVDGDGKVTLADDLQMRIDLANRSHGTLFLSIHFNGYADPAMSGSTIYYDDARPFADRSRYFAGLLDRDLVAALGGIGYSTINRGVQTDSQAVGYGSHFYVLGPDAARPIQMPGALAEGLFVTNPRDAAALHNPQTIDTIAHAYAKAIQEYSGPLP